jgi:hypothetical protein
MNQEGQGPPLDSSPYSARQGRKWQPLRDLQTFSTSFGEVQLTPSVVRGSAQSTEYSTGPWHSEVVGYMLMIGWEVKMEIPCKEKQMAKCPYCKQAITLEKTKRESAEFTEEVHKDVSGLVKKEIMYSCPHCESVLGFGFFLGGLLTGRP